jgi:hypothetical protein
MPVDLGLFLERTWRLHPDICAFTSEAFYEGRLDPEPGRERQALTGTPPLDGTGPRYLRVPHEGRDNESIEEAAKVADVVGRLLASASSWTDDEGDTHPLALPDVLILTPYNAQVRTIGEALPGAHVGTVDKFQGQEAPISIYSMATSAPEDAPRGMEFLYSLHRLNVATSRARCLTAVIASPELIRVKCRTPRQMRLANGFARLVELAKSEDLVTASDVEPIGDETVEPRTANRGRGWSALGPASGLRVESVAEGLRLASNSDSRLVLLVADDSRVLRAAAADVGEELGWALLDLNTVLATQLLPLTPVERRDEAWDALEDVLGDHRAGLILTSTDVLFDPTLEYRPYEALRRIGRRGPLVATWFGTVNNGEITRGTPGHPEHVRARLDVPYVHVMAKGGRPG